MEKDYSILNLDRADCGTKIEEAISKLEGVEMAILNFPLKKIKVIGDISDDTLRRMNETASDIETGVEIVPVAEKKTVRDKESGLRSLRRTDRRSYQSA